MKTLLQINALANTGSTGRIAEGIGKLALRQGWQSYIAYGRRAQLSHSRLIPIGNKFSIGWHGLQTRLCDRHGFASTHATHQLIQEIKRISPDVIQLHNLHGYYLNIRILFDFLAHTTIPVVWTLHDCWAMTGHCAHFQNNGCNQWQQGCSHCQFLHSYPASWFKDASAQNYKDKKACFTSVKNMTIVPVCHWLGGIVKNSYLKSYPVYPILNGIDVQQFAPTDPCRARQKYALENKFILLAAASVWTMDKGWNDILCLSHLLQPDEVILLLGATPRQIRELPSNVIGIPHTESISELAACYSAAHVFINPTYQDTFPTVNLEALACGTPVVTYATGGCAESVDEKTGYVVQRGQIGELYAAVSAIRQQGKSAFTDACRQKANEQFNDQKQYQKYIDLYQKRIELS